VTGYICLIYLLVLDKKKNLKTFSVKKKKKKTIIDLILVNLQTTYGQEPSPESLQQGGFMFV